MAMHLNHGILDSKLRENKVFKRKSIEYKKNAFTLLNTDPYFRFKRILIEASNYTDFSQSPEWLDLGCHAGQFMSIVKDVHKVNVTGIDDWDLKEQWTEDEYTYYQFDLNKDWSEILKGNKFHVISALEVIEHIIDTDAFLKRCNNVLHSNGLLIISTPNINCLRNRIIVPLGKYPAFMEYRNIIHHVRLYNIATIKEHLKKYGFQIKKISGVSFLPEGANKYPILRNLSDGLGNIFPSLSNNIIIVASKIKEC